MATDKETEKNIKLGLFVSSGLILLIISVYFIGSKKNLFSSTFNAYAIFSDVSGLQTGNNVRFIGIDIGTVKKITVTSDSTIEVLMAIENKYRSFIRKNSSAGIATDGLMGNKIILLEKGTQGSAIIGDSDTLSSIQPVDAEDVIRTLSASSYNVKEITDDLKRITKKIDDSNSLWSLLSDSAIAENLEQAIVNIKLTSSRSAIISGDLSGIATDIRSGKGLVGALVTDTLLTSKLRQTIVEVQLISDTLALVSGDLKNITGTVRKGEGAVGTLLMDTAFVQKLNEIMENLSSGTAGFDENMEALKHNILFRKYFKQKNK